MATFNDARVRPANTAQPAKGRDYVLYWMQMFRRLDRNHALDYAVHAAKSMKKPLVIYEGLKLGYPWASPRHHRFILEGMRCNARKAKQLGVNYWPFVETPSQSGRGLLRQLASRACLVVTDDYPAFIVPEQIHALASKVDVPVTAIDGNSIVPLSLLGNAVSACAHLRPRIHKLFPDAWEHQASIEPEYPAEIRKKIDPPFVLWNPEVHLDEFLATLPLDPTVPAVPGIEGGSDAGRAILDGFIARKLANYAEGRNNPDDPRQNAASGLSAHLHYGHISMQEVAERVLNHAGSWTPATIDPKSKGKREGYYHRDPNVNSFLDEAITWRDVGYHWHYKRNADLGYRSVQQKTIDGESIPVYQDLASTLPAWAMTSLQNHAKDRRDFNYTLKQWEQGKTHDDLWNAAQQELVATGRIHNYLRMLWGKKVLEWSPNPEVAYAILEHLNNKYALDGRDPNSYTGLLWCFGLFDRPWFERDVFGVIRYMSSDNTAKKFKLQNYYRYIGTLPKISEVRAGQTVASRKRSLFE